MVTCPICGSALGENDRLMIHNYNGKAVVNHVVGYSASSEVSSDNETVTTAKFIPWCGLNFGYEIPNLMVRPA